MMLSIDQLLETLSNPEGRFKTLSGIHLENENGEPGYLLRSGGAVAIFRVWLEERSCELSCALKNREQRSVSACLRVNFLQRITAPYLVDYEFHGQEMLLFDTMGNSFDIDVVLTERPQGVGLDKALSELCDRGERGPLFALRKTFCEMASWLLRSPIVHGALKPVNVIVAPDGTCRLIRYEAMRVPGMEELSEHWGDDTVAAANLAIGLSLLCAAPALYRICNGDSLFHTPLLRSSLLPLVSDMARESSCEPLLQLVEMLSRGGFALDREQLADVLEVLACDKTDMTLPVDRLNRLRTEITTPSPSPKPVTPPATTVRADLSLYDWVGPMCEALICVQRGSKWGYLNSDGTVAIPLRYDWADDFLEGRAVVRIGDQFGLIDKEGNEMRCWLPFTNRSIGIVGTAWLVSRMKAKSDFTTAPAKSVLLRSTIGWAIFENRICCWCAKRANAVTSVIRVRWLSRSSMMTHSISAVPIALRLPCMDAHL